MIIHVVQPGDTIFSIAQFYGVSVRKLVENNDLDNPNQLVTGQTIVIVYPEQTYTVQEGDTLAGIADAYDISVMQLLRLNPFLSNRKYIYPGETLVIRYHEERTINTIGFAYPYIYMDTLLKTLPNLTYLSIFNYKVTGEGEIITYFDDTEIIQITKDYGTVPLMMATTLSALGQPNIEAAYIILLSEEIQELFIKNAMEIMKAKGYMGLNIIFNFINVINQELYHEFTIRISNRLKMEGYLLFITINPKISTIDQEIIFEKIDYSIINKEADCIIFLEFIWGTNTEPPAPVCSISELYALANYVSPMVSPDKTMFGKPIISYDWELPYVPGRTIAHSLTLNGAINLALDTGVPIQFDEPSQTPYFLYYDYVIGAPVQHIVWSIDARSIRALDQLNDHFCFRGSAIWNIMIYYAQLWLVINSQYRIEKLLPEI